MHSTESFTVQKDKNVVEGGLSINKHPPERMRTLPMPSYKRVIIVYQI